MAATKPKTSPTDTTTTAEQDVTKLTGNDQGSATSQAEIPVTLPQKYGQSGVSNYETSGFPFNFHVIDITDETTQLLLLDDKQTNPSKVETGYASTFPSTVDIVGFPGATPQYIYKGSKLVEDNKLVRNQYDVYSSEATGQINSEYYLVKNDAERSSLFSTIYRMGYYQGGKPSSTALAGLGMSNADRNALGDFLDFSNRNTKTWRQMLKDVASGKINIGAATGAGTGRKISVVSREDASRNIGDAFFTILGRAPTSEEIKIGVKAIQDADRSRQSSGIEDPASLAAAAAGQAQKASPSEAGAYSMGQALNQVFALLGGR
jgi:hypothetical protein